LPFAVPGTLWLHAASLTSSCMRQVLSSPSWSGGPAKKVILTSEAPAHLLPSHIDVCADATPHLAGTIRQWVSCTDRHSMRMHCCHPVGTCALGSQLAAALLMPLPCNAVSDMLVAHGLWFGDIRLAYSCCASLPSHASAATPATQVQVAKPAATAQPAAAATAQVAA
jgi:hypothetical protein